MGFCVFNNVAVAALQARAVHRLSRLAIFDFDVHHGNGTQDDLLRRPRHALRLDPPVAALSGHRAAHERGIKGNILNRPLPPGTGSEAWRRVVERDVLPAIDGLAAAADLRLGRLRRPCRRSAGQHGAGRGGLRLGDARAARAGRTPCDGRIVSVLEGGYDPAALARSVVAHLQVLSRGDATLMAEPVDRASESSGHAGSSGGADELRGGAGRARDASSRSSSAASSTWRARSRPTSAARRLRAHCADKLRQVQLRVEKLTLGPRGQARSCSRSRSSEPSRARRGRWRPSPPPSRPSSTALLPPVDGPQARLHEAMRYAVLGGGKRLRPVPGRGQRPTLFGRAAARRDPGRGRGRADPRLLAGPRRPAGDGRRRAAPRPAGLPRAFDEATAILAGDALQPLAFEVLARPRLRRRRRAARRRWCWASPARPGARACAAARCST